MHAHAGILAGVGGHDRRHAMCLSRRMCGRPDDTHAGACTMWVGRLCTRLSRDRPRVGNSGKVQLSIAQSPYGYCGTDIYYITTVFASAGMDILGYV